MKDSMKSSGKHSVHADTKGECPKPPMGYGVKGMTSVGKDACRESTAPTPASLGGRNA